MMLIPFSSLRSRIGIVPQAPILFNDTIMNNVRYARLDATDEDVYDACRAAAIHEQILGFSDGMWNSRMNRLAIAWRCELLTLVQVTTRELANAASSCPVVNCREWQSLGQSSRTHLLFFSTKLRARWIQRPNRRSRTLCKPCALAVPHLSSRKLCLLHTHCIIYLYQYRTNLCSLIGTACLPL